MVDPIIINLKNNHIIGGHQRYNIIQDQSMQNNEFDLELNLIKLGDIGWVFPNTNLQIENENYEKALNIALNKITGQFDETKLNDLLTKIDFDISKLGLSINENEISEDEFKFMGSHSTDSIKLDYELIKFGNYLVKLTHEEIELWEEQLIEEADEKNIAPEDLIIERLQF